MLATLFTVRPLVGDGVARSRMKPRVEIMKDKENTDPSAKDRPRAEDLPDGSNSDGSASQAGEDTASGGGADDD
jgi:hypothetical protein